MDPDVDRAGVITPAYAEAVADGARGLAGYTQNKQIWGDLHLTQIWGELHAIQGPGVHRAERGVCSCGGARAYAEQCDKACLASFQAAGMGLEGANE